MITGYTNTSTPDISWWMEQIQKGIKFRKEFTNQNQWDIWRKYYRGQWNNDTMPVNLFFKMARTVVPRVYFRNPSISVTPGKAGMLNWAFAQLVERIDNKIMRDMRMKRTFKDIVTNTWFFGAGISKVGFGGVYSYNQDDHGGAAPVTRTGNRVETNFNASDFMPWVGSTHPGNFIVPENLIRFHQTPWCAEWIQRPRWEVENDPRLKNNKDMKPSARSNRGGQLQHEHRKTEIGDMIDLIEIHDLRTGKVIVIAPYSSEKELYFGNDDLAFFGKPNYMPVIFNENDNAFWGVPDSQHLQYEQVEANEIRTMMMIHWRLAVMKIIYQKGKVDPDEIQKMIDGEILAAIGVSGDARAALQVLQAGDIPDSLFKADAMIAQDVREGQGFGRNEFGDVSPANARTSAFESKVAKMSSDIRVDERRDMIADSILDTMEHVNRIIFNYWTQEQVIDIVGPLGVPLWIKFKPQMLKEQTFNINVDPDTSLPQTKDQREAKADKVYMVLKDNPMIDPMRLTRYYLHEQHGVQFDDMMRGMPPGVGGPSHPLELEQYIQLTTQIAQRAPQALLSPSQKIGLTGGGTSE